MEWIMIINLQDNKDMEFLVWDPTKFPVFSHVRLSTGFSTTAFEVGSGSSNNVGVKYRKANSLRVHEVLLTAEAAAAFFTISACHPKNGFCVI